MAIGSVKFNTEKLWLSLAIFMTMVSIAYWTVYVFNAYSTFHEYYDAGVAEDGSDDGSEEIVKKLSKLKLVRVTSAANRRGRGGAIKDAIKISRGQVVGYVDIDLATPLRYIKKAGESCRKWQQNSNRF